mgnify:CR=1 FL=1
MYYANFVVHKPIRFYGGNKQTKQNLTRQVNVRLVTSQELDLLVCSCKA